MNEVKLIANHTVIVGETVFTGFNRQDTDKVMFVDRILSLLPETLSESTDFTLSLGYGDVAIGDTSSFSKVYGLYLYAKQGQIILGGILYNALGDVVYVDSDKDDIFQLNDPEYPEYKRAIAERLYTAFEYRRGVYGKVTT